MEDHSRRFRKLIFKCAVALGATLALYYYTGSQLLAAIVGTVGVVAYVIVRVRLSRRRRRMANAGNGKHTLQPDFQGTP